MLFIQATYFGGGFGTWAFLALIWAYMRQFVGGVIACVASSYCIDEFAVVSLEQGMEDCPSLSGYSDGQRFL